MNVDIKSHIKGFKICTFQYVEKQLECNKSADLISEILKCVSKRVHNVSLSFSNTSLNLKKTFA